MSLGPVVGGAFALALGGGLCLAYLKVTLLRREARKARARARLGARWRALPYLRAAQGLGATGGQCRARLEACARRGLLRLGGAGPALAATAQTHYLEYLRLKDPFPASPWWLRLLVWRLRRRCARPLTRALWGLLRRYLGPLRAALLLAFAASYL